MPEFRVSGTWSCDFVVTIEAESLDDACDLAAQFSPGDFDATTYAPTRIDDCTKLDENGEEVSDA